MSTAQEMISVEALRNIGLFGALPDSALEFLRARAEVVATAPGTEIFREGEVGDRFYIVVDGELDVIKRGRSSADTRVAVLGPGDWFGEMSVVDVQPRSASVRAVSAARLLAVSASNLDALYREDLKSYCLIVLNIARGLSRRLRVADGLLADMVASVVGRTRPPAG